MSEIQETHDERPAPVPADVLIRFFSRETHLYPVFVVANRDLETQREVLSTLKTKVSQAMNEADLIFANFCSSLKTSAITGFIAFISVKTILSCINLLVSVALAVLLLCTIISPLLLAIRRFKVTFYDLEELEREQRVFLQTVENGRKYYHDLVKFVHIELPKESLGSKYFEGVDRLIVQLKLILGDGSSFGGCWKVCKLVPRYPTLYKSSMVSACVALLVYFGTVYYLEDWEACAKGKPHIGPIIRRYGDILLKAWLRIMRNEWVRD